MLAMYPEGPKGETTINTQTNDETGPLARSEAPMQALVGLTSLATHSNTLRFLASRIREFSWHLCGKLQNG